MGVMGKRFKKSTVVLAMLCMLAAILIPGLRVGATDTDTAITTSQSGEYDARESILKLLLGYTDDNGNTLYYQAGTCFLINDTYVLTNKHVVVPSEVTRQQIMKDFGLTERLSDKDKHLTLSLLVNRDMMIPAKVHENVQSDNMDFAAVELEGKIYDRTPVVMGDSDTVEIKADVFAMGFPSDSELTKDFNTKEDVSTVSGKISKVTVKDSVDVFEHTATLNFGNSGGPLLNSNNEVIAINTYKNEGKSYSVQINHIKKALDTFGIPYTSADSSPSPSPDTTMEDPVPVIEDDNALLISELESQLSTAKAMDTVNYTEESIKMLDDNIGTAEAVLKNTSASAQELQAAIDDLKSTMNSMEEKTGPNIMLLMIIVVVVVVIVIIIIVIIVMISSRKKKEEEARRKMLDPAHQTGIKQQGGMGYQQGTSPVQHTTPPIEGIGETVLLNSGEGDTTVLSSNAGAYLIRKKNGEKIVINSGNFTIGKERRRVNYCISDNTSVSRCHAIIIKKGLDYFVVDQNATNFTYLNGSKLNPNQETMLTDKSVLKLSDEEFEFRLG